MMWIQEKTAVTFVPLFYIENTCCFCTKYMQQILESYNNLKTKTKNYSELVQTLDSQLVGLDEKKRK